MKKLLSLLLCVVMALALVSCGSDAESDQPASDKQPTTENSQQQEKEEYERQSNGVYILTAEQAKPYMTRIELTLDNYQQYFENHTVPYHTERKNEFGEVEYICDGVYRYFGVADYDVVVYDSVAFKSMRYTDYYENGRNDENVMEYTSWERYIDADGGAWLSRYPTESQAEKWDSIAPPDTGYYKATDFDYIFSGKHYYEITDVTGSIIVMDFPDELWTEIDGHKYIEVDGEYFVRDKSTPEGVAIKETGSRFNRWFE